MIRKHKALFITFAFLVLITFLSREIPFFWDGPFFSTIALEFYNGNWNGFIAPASHDTGGFPLFSFYLATMWSVFGKSLALSHFYILPLLLATALEYYKLASAYLKGNLLTFAMLLLLLESAFITQGIIMGYDVLMVWLFLYCINLLREKKRIFLAIFLCLLCLSSMRGIVLAASIFTIDIFLFKLQDKKRFWSYVPAILSLTCWALYHESRTGWYIFSPERDSTHEALLPAAGMIRQAGFIIWKLADNGKIFLWTFAIIAYFKYRKKNPASYSLTVLLLVPAFLLLLMMMIFANPVGPRYFIATFLLLNIYCCFMLQHLEKIYKTGIATILAAALITGNFWIYPIKYGNSWDASLKVLPYFSMKKKMDDFIRKASIDPAKVGTQFPLISDNRTTLLSNEPFQYRNVWRGPVENFEYYLHSNVINTDIPEQIERVVNNWEAIHSEECGQVVLTLYRRPG
jgi:hypothetical protein